MKLKFVMLHIIMGLFFYFGCSNNSEIQLQEEMVEELDDTTDEIEDNSDDATEEKSTIKILALGDSYTIGQSVCETCRFPEQLKDSLKNNLEYEANFQLKIIAKTGWPTASLISAIENENLSQDYNLVTLLIGVNNQYQNRPFSVYETEFPQLVNLAISKVGGTKGHLIVISIPDYAYTPFGNGNETISKEIDQYNNFAEKYCVENNIKYVNITDITRMGLINPALVASDGLHPSELAYSKFVERILPAALNILKN